MGLCNRHSSTVPFQGPSCNELLEAREDDEGLPIHRLLWPSPKLPFATPLNWFNLYAAAWEELCLSNPFWNHEHVHVDFPFIISHYHARIITKRLGSAHAHQMHLTKRTPSGCIRYQMCSKHWLHRGLSDVSRGLPNRGALGRGER